MAKRIRYSKVDGIKISNTTFKTPKGEVKVLINPVDKTYRIVLVNTTTVVAEGKGVSGHSVQKAAKNALSKLGAVFSAERREKSYKDVLKTLDINL